MKYYSKGTIFVPFCIYKKYKSKCYIEKHHFITIISIICLHSRVKFNNIQQYLFFLCKKEQFLNSNNTFYISVIYLIIMHKSDPQSLCKYTKFKKHVIKILIFRQMWYKIVLSNSEIMVVIMPNFIRECSKWAFSTRQLIIWSAKKCLVKGAKG